MMQQGYDAFLISKHLVLQHRIYISILCIKIKCIWSFNIVFGPPKYKYFNNNSNSVILVSHIKHTEPIKMLCPNSFSVLHLIIFLLYVYPNLSNWVFDCAAQLYYIGHLSCKPRYCHFRCNKNCKRSWSFWSVFYIFQILTLFPLIMIFLSLSVWTKIHLERPLLFYSIFRWKDIWGGYKTWSYG